MTDKRTEAESIAYINFANFSMLRYPWLSGLPLRYKKLVLLEMHREARQCSTPQSNPESPVPWGRLLSEEAFERMLERTKEETETSPLDRDLRFCLEVLR